LSEKILRCVKQLRTSREICGGKGRLTGRGVREGWGAGKSRLGIEELRAPNNFFLAWNFLIELWDNSTFGTVLEKAKVGPDS
jgi:hypothetical protein